MNTPATLACYSFRGYRRAEANCRHRKCHVCAEGVGGSCLFFACELIVGHRCEWRWRSVKFSAGEFHLGKNISSIGVAYALEDRYSNCHRAEEAFTEVG